MLHRVRVASWPTVAIWMMLVPHPAAGAASARLVYVRGPGAETCPGEDALRAAVATRLGYDPFFAWARDTLLAEIVRTVGVFSAVIKLVDETNTERGAREIFVHGDDCSAVIDALGLIISLGIDPSSVVGVRSPPPPSAPPSTQPSAIPALSSTPSDAVLPHESAMTSATSSSVSTYAGLAAALTVGAAPALSTGATLFAGLASGRLSLDVEVRADLPATGPNDRGVPNRVTSWLIAGSIVPRGHLGFAFACAVGAGGAQGATSNALLPETSYGPWWGAGARIGAGGPLNRSFFWRLYAQVLATFARNILSVDRGQEYRFPPFSGTAGLAVDYRFP
jgi:hypothetical protein